MLGSGMDLKLGTAAHATRWSHRNPVLTALAALVIGACGQGVPAKEASSTDTRTMPAKASAAPLMPEAPPVEPPLVGLGWGSEKPLVLGEISGVVIERLTLGAVDWFQVRPPKGWREAANQNAEQPFDTDFPEVFVSLLGQPGFLSGENNDLWVQYPAGAKESQLKLSVAIARTHQSVGVVLPVKFEAKGTATTGAKAKEKVARAFSDYLLTRRDLPIAEFALDRLSSLGKVSRPELRDSFERSGEFSELMDLTSGAKSVRAALQSRSKLRSNVDGERPTIPLTRLIPPSIPRHPWPQMLELLRTEVPNEPLAAAVPADFYFARARDVQALFEILDEIDDWGTPLADVVEGNSERAGLSERYRTQLALPRTALSRLMGPQLIQSLALVGSDPWLRQGSDVTVIFQVKSPDLFRAGLNKNLAELEETQGAMTTSSSTHQGVQISSYVSKNLAVHTHQASHRGFELVSNSKNALSRVIDTLDGKYPALKDEPDFKYMLARDPQVKDDVLAFAGDRFVEAIVSPQARVLDARRQVAQAELLRPGYAALVYGWLFGQEPKDAQSLLASALLLPTDLVHFDKSPISFQPGAAPRSSFGMPAHLTPLIDSPALTKVTPQEQAAYEEFSERYSRLWSDALDPIALRITLAEVSGKKQLEAKLRVLPLVNDSDYRQILEVVGQSKLTPGEPSGGVRVLFSIARDSELHRSATQASRSLLGTELKLDWLGDYGMLGCLDRNEVANVLADKLNPKGSHSSDEDDVEKLRQLPIYAALAVRKRTAAALLLTMLRAKLAGEVGEFNDVEEYKGAKIVQVTIDRSLDLFYALSDKGLYFATQPWVIRQLIDTENQVLDSRTQVEKAKVPKQGPGGTGQFVLDVRAKQHGGLATALGWAFEHHAATELNTSSAEPLLLGAPSVRGNPSAYRQLAMNYLGTVPLTPEATPFELDAYGIKDPARGTRVEPTWPKPPVAGSSAAKVLAALELFRAQLGFDAEPTPAGAEPLQSLVVNMSIRRH